MSYTCLPIGSHTFWLLYCVPLSTTLPTLNIRRERKQVRGEMGTDLFRLISADQGHQVPRGKSSFSHQNVSNQQKQQPPPFLSGFLNLHILKSPQNSKHKLSAAGKKQPLLEHETVTVSSCQQSEDSPYPTPGIKADHLHITEFLKKWKFLLHSSLYLSCLFFLLGLAISL